VKEQPLIAVYGLWHLGCVTAASLSQAGFQVWGLDEDATVIERLKAGQPPIFEPGLAELIGESQANGNLHFTTDVNQALKVADILWVAFDTPVDEQDRADVGYVEQQLEAVYPYLATNCIIIISSQLPVGSTTRLKERWSKHTPVKSLVYCYSPENLRLGNALKSFRAEDRIVVGLDGDEGRELIGYVLGKFCPRLEWMSVSSAEMTKHALNSFLAVSVAMINEIARLCEVTGADAKEVERGLKSEARIGPKSYLGPGGPFAGGTLARDLRFLTELGTTFGLETPLLSGTLASNEIHKGWVQQAAASLLEDLPKPAQVTILGLSYKAGTDTLRRSEAVSLALWLNDNYQAEIRFHDPVASSLPEELARRFSLTANLETALAGADLLIVATGWPQYREQINPEVLGKNMRRPAVIDQNRYLVEQVGLLKNIPYLAVGKPR